MGSLERDSKKKTRRVKIQNILLQSVYAAGVISVAVLAPNALQVMKQFDVGKKRRKNPKYSVNSAIDRLQDKGFIYFEKTSRGTFVRLTEEGKTFLAKNGLLEPQIKKPRRWDKKWRIIIFDIKEKRRMVRDTLRTTLLKIGFIRLQDSVWVYPYDCEDLIILLKADFKIGKDVLYIIADRIENDAFLRQHFAIK